MVKIKDEFLKALYREIRDTCFWDKNLYQLKEIIWGHHFGTSICYPSEGLILISKNTKNFDRDIIHELMHMIYPNTTCRKRNGNLFKELVEANVELLNAVRNSEYKKAKEYRRKIEGLEELTTTVHYLFCTVDNTYFR